MVTLKEKKSLFGGAFRCAGLAAAATMASSTMADFDPLAPGPGFVANQTLVYAAGPASYFFDYDYTYAAQFALTTSYAAAGFSASAYAGSTLIGVNHTVTDSATWAYSVSNTIQWFTAATFSKDVTFSWDLTNTSNSVAYVYEVGVGVISPIGVEGTSGSVNLTLDNASTYAFLGQIVISGVNGTGFAHIVNVPAPGALAMLGLGALTTRKRRRHN